jgi:hypothetical protein
LLAIASDNRGNKDIIQKRAAGYLVSTNMAKADVNKIQQAIYQTIKENLSENDMKKFSTLDLKKLLLALL